MGAIDPYRVATVLQYTIPYRVHWKVVAKAVCRAEEEQCILSRIM